MEERIYFGKYVLVNYLSLKPNGEEWVENVYGGKLERIVFEKGQYKILFKSYYKINGDNQYKSSKSKLPKLIILNKDNYLGITPMKKKHLKEFYDEINVMISKSVKEKGEFNPGEISEDGKMKLGFYDHDTKLGFMKS